MSFLPLSRFPRIIFLLLPLLTTFFLADSSLYAGPSSNRSGPPEISFQSTGETSDLPSPRQYFGHRVGADRQVFGYESLLKYLSKLESTSDRMVSRNLGTSTRGREMRMNIISTPENLDRLDHIKQTSRDLSRPDDIPRSQLDSLVEEGTAVIAVTMGIHSNEMMTTQVGAQLAYDLTADRTPWSFQDIFDDVVLLMIPSLNPDGHDREVNWYQKQKGTSYEGGPYPGLYHHYAGHSVNRDWFMLNLPESRNVSRVFYRTWRPQVIVDIHQMWTRGPRMFVPPYTDPLHGDVHPNIWRSANRFGTAVAHDLQREEKKGVQHESVFSGWWPGTSVMTPFWHNQVGILFEIASTHRASPVHVDPSEVGTERSVNNPNPWQGGWWRPRDIINYARTGVYSVLKTASRDHEGILRDRYRMGEDGLERNRGEPYAYLIPPDQRDGSALAKFIDIMTFKNIQLRRAEHSFQVEQRQYPEGTLILPLAQPRSPFVQAMMSEQTYPEGERSYDVTGWTLPYLLGIEFEKATRPVETETTPVASPELAVEPRDFLSVPASSTDAATLVNRIQQRESGTVFLDTRTNQYHMSLPQKNLLKDLHFAETNPPSDSLKEQLRNISGNHDEGPEENNEQQTNHGTDSDGLFHLHPPRIGVFQAATGTRDEGFTRLLLDSFEFDYTSIGPEAIKEGNLGEQFDILVFPSMSRRKIQRGPRSRGNIPRLPEKYRQGIGKKGVSNVKNFIQNGGSALAWGRSTSFLLQHIPVPVSRHAPDDNFSAPGSLLRVNNEQDPPEMAGSGKTSSVFYDRQASAFRTRIPFGPVDRTVLARYAEEDQLLMSGYLDGGNQMAGQPAAVRATWKEGTITLFGYRPQFRTWTRGTYPAVFLSLYASAYHSLPGK